MKDQLPQLIKMHILIPGANTLRFFTGRGYERQKAQDHLKCTIFQGTEEDSFCKKKQPMCLTWWKPLSTLKSTQQYKILGMRDVYEAAEILI